MSQHRITPKAGWVDQSKLQKGAGGRPLCRWCGKETQPPRRTFCSKACVHEHKLRSQPGYARQHVWTRDGGICSACGCNTQALQATLIQLRHHIRQRAGYSNLHAFDYRADPEWIEVCEQHGLNPAKTDPDKTLWNMDHTRPVVEGGGECGLDNLRTLCLGCHRQATGDLQKRRRGRDNLPKESGD